MEVIILDGFEQIAESASNMVCDLISLKHNAVLGLATGSTPINLYQNLVQRYGSRNLSMKQVTSFNLDEYLGLEWGHPQSYRSFMEKYLFDHVDISKENVFFPECAEGQDPRHVGPAYEALIAERGGVDLQLLGIGGNGHVGFNEPTSSMVSRTRVKTLAQRTVTDNARLFSDGEYQPQLAITMGIGTILDSRRILLLAQGIDKAAAVRDMVEGPVSSMCPASALQQHPRVRVLLDREAASELELADYYQWVNVESRAVASAHDSVSLSDPWFFDLL